MSTLVPPTLLSPRPGQADRAKVEADGRSKSIWDTFSADPSHSEDGGSTAVATDFYNQFHADIDLMKEYGESRILTTSDAPS